LFKVERYNFNFKDRILCEVERYNFNLKVRILCEVEQYNFNFKVVRIKNVMAFLNGISEFDHQYAGVCLFIHIYININVNGLAFA